MTMQQIDLSKSLKIQDCKDPVVDQTDFAPAEVDEITTMSMK